MAAVGELPIVVLSRSPWPRWWRPAALRLCRSWRSAVAVAWTFQLRVWACIGKDLAGTADDW